MRRPEDRPDDTRGEEWSGGPGFGGLLRLWARFPGAVRRVATTGEPEVLSYRGRVLGAVISISDLERLREIEAAGQQARERAAE